MYLLINSRMFSIKLSKKYYAVIVPLVDFFNFNYNNKF